MGADVARAEVGWLHVNAVVKRDALVRRQGGQALAAGIEGGECLGAQVGVDGVTVVVVAAADEEMFETADRFAPVLQFDGVAVVSGGLARRKGEIIQQRRFVRHFGGEETVGGIVDGWGVRRECRATTDVPVVAALFEVAAGNGAVAAGLCRAVIAWCQRERQALVFVVMSQGVAVEDEDAPRIVAAIDSRMGVVRQQSRQKEDGNKALHGRLGGIFRGGDYNRFAVKSLRSACPSSGRQHAVLLHAQTIDCKKK